MLAEVDTLLYRSMAGAASIGPDVGPSARKLGVRPDIDIVADAFGRVHPASGGLSICPSRPEDLPQHRRPPEHGGSGKDPVWCIAVAEIGADLAYRPDPARADVHGFIEPARTMSLDEFQAALAATQALWRPVP